MTNTVHIEDDFDLKKIATSGQCFRVREDRVDRAFQFVHKGYVLKISKNISENNSYSISCGFEEWKSIWHDYFDLDRSYNEIRKSVKSNNTFLNQSLDFGAGLRILKQDPWEMIVTFIISQRRSMPSIATCVEKICKKYGNLISETGFDMAISGSGYEKPNEIYDFPAPETLANANLNDLRACGLGYRAEYVKGAAELVVANSNHSNRRKPSDILSKMNEMADDELYDFLTSFHGIGKKVASCIMLFGFFRTSLAPVDVWIERVINENFSGVNPFDDFGKNAGIIQQYLFFYKTHAR